eukprot:m.499197 g.499197  ORF g.499197 m.499197 type:complete len:106 (+) comp21825_c0_seq4:401-718(+)
MVGTVREIFLCYLSEMLRASGASSSTAIALSGTFPLLGVPGLMLSGYLVDHYDRKRNGEIVAVNCGVLLVLAMILWWIKQFMASPPLCAIVRGVTGNLWMQSIHT